jgi:ATP-dependent Clp protease ATP-binding subunit ClpC
VSATSLRVYFVTHHDGRKTGILMRAWGSFFSGPPPSAYGADEAEVLALLERTLLRAQADGSDSVERYLWAEPFQVQKTRVDVRPMTTVKKRAAIGKAVIPLRISYAWTRVKTVDEGRNELPRDEIPHAYRVMLPRFGLWFVLEDLEAAGEVLSVLLSFWLLGESPKWVYDLRAEGEEYVRNWEPDLLSRRAERPREDEPPPPELGKIADDLVELLGRGKLAPVIGEAPEAPELAAAAARTPLPSLLLVGPPGAGKSALVRRLARVVVERAREERERGRPRLWSTSADRILAGMVWLGQWQERVFALIEELSGTNQWLYVDRLAALAKPQPDGSSIAEMLEPALAAGDLSLIAEATPSELEQLRRKHASLVQRFRVVRVEEKSAEATAQLIAPYAARKPTLTLEPDAVRRLVRHVADLQLDQALPGKAFRFVDWLASSTAEKKTFRARDVSEAFSRFTGLPIELLSDEYAASAADLAAKLRARVIGQDEACAACGRLLARFKAGMNDPERPCGTLLFVGPTGVGKTELAKQLARQTFGDASRLVRIDMSEYGLRGSAQRLLEVGEGVTSLAQQVGKQPLSLVLLDEIEKAHPDVFDLLLGVLGEGRLTDSGGRLVDFRGTIIILTSNLGVSDRSAVGFGGGDGGDYVRAVRQHFRPELFNRIDAVLSFRPLSPADVERIVDLTIDEVRSRPGLARRGLTLKVSTRARAELARLGFHPTHGARPLKRTVEERVVTPLAAALSGDASMRDRAFAVVVGDEPVPAGATPIVL